MELPDKKLQCADCSQDFIFSAGEQQFFALRQLVNEPKRCPNCRLSMRFNRAGRDASILTDVQCADCEKNVKVPFKPRGHKPVYCNDCLASHKVVAKTQQLATSACGA
jgi:CxxC-x17-CxxC domain-containing protein